MKCENEGVFEVSRIWCMRLNGILLKSSKERKNSTQKDSIKKNLVAMEAILDGLASPAKKRLEQFPFVK